MTDFVPIAALEEEYVYKEEVNLTVLKTSMFYAGDGFSVYNSTGDLLFRVDSYGPDPREASELVLMDAAGKCLLTVRRKRPSLHQRWEGYLGEGTEETKPMFSVRRSSIIGRSNITVEMYNNSGEEYQIEGSFANRNCMIFNASRETVAEIKRKVDACSGVLLGNDVFSLCVKPGFDCAFAMSLVLVLDRINGDDYFDGNGKVVPTAEGIST